MIIKSIALITCVLCLNVALEADSNLTKEQIEKQLQKERKFAQEQKFYNADEYDFSGAEVNPESLKHIKPIEVDDMDMDDVYD
jgi:hypothetical protein